MTRPCRYLRVLGASLLVCSFVSMGPVNAAAQSPEPPEADASSAPPPAHISYVDGAAVLERDGQNDNTPSNMPLLAGDRVRTVTGRVEILFADGSTLHLDTRTTVDFQSDELVRVLDGRIRLAIPGPDRGVSYRIDAPSASVEIAQPGEYRVAVQHGAREGEIELAVLRGAADLVNDDGRTSLRAGERAYARASIAPSNAYVFNSATWDAFDRWSEARRAERLSAEATYLPDEVRPYAASFDQYGSWQYDASYGNVWYPSVATGWRPYYNGRWVTLPSYGWTWVGSDPWAWPTHHYGRWGVSAGVWFWIPGRSWAPAWVSWAYAPGYVSWCPLGWNNRAVFQINAGFHNRGYDPWRAWTVVPQRHFGAGYVNTRYVAGNTFDAHTRGAFVSRSHGPDVRGYAVPRASAPIRVAGTGGRRPGSSPVYTNLGPGDSRVGGGPSRTMVAPRSAPAGLARPDAPGLGADRARAVPRGAVDTQSGQARVTVPGGAGRDSQPGQPRSSVPAAAAVYAAPDRRAVPRDTTTYPSRRPYDATTGGADPVAGRPARGSAYTPVYRADDYGRRAPEQRAPDSGSLPGYARGGENRGPAGGYAAPRSVLDGPRSSPPPQVRDPPRSAPDSPRPSSPPPQYRDAPRSAPIDRPAARPADRAPDRPSAAPSDGGRQRSGGQPSSGTATRRPGR